MNAALIPKTLFISKTYATTEGNKTGSWRFLKPRYENKTSPCSAACPAGEDVAMIEMLATQGLFKEAWKTILRENPFPGVCGRVCFHPCEGACNRKDFDSPIGINSMERFLADTASRNGLKPAMEMLPPKDQKIAVIGAGPAGLSAGWFLGNLGYACDIYESLSEAGGILRWGIPEYRLPPAVLREEIARIESERVRILTGKHVSESMLRELRSQYSAVFISCGYSRSTPLGITGETPESVKDGLSFLKSVRQGDQPDCSGLSVVIGGGNTAIDIARTIIRFGGKAVILYRRLRQDMPAFGDEVSMVLEEEVELKELLAPSAIESQGGRLKLTLSKMKIDGKGKDGRNRVVADGVNTTQMDVDRVFAATGSDAAESWYRPPLDRKEVVPLSHCALVIEGGGAPVIYGGDLANETRNVTHAIASGKQASIALDVYFQQGSDAIKAKLEACKVGNGPALSMEMYLGGARGLRNSHIVQRDELNADYFQNEPRVKKPSLDVEARRSVFDEVELGISANAAIVEAGRCFQCGLCNQCDNCFYFCPDMAVVRKRNESRDINYDYCKGCGLCVMECPRCAMALGEEEI